MKNKSDLERLQEKYGHADGGDFFDPLFRKVADQVFKGSRRKWPFCSPATLLDAPYDPDAPLSADFHNLDVALIGIPMDLGVTNRAGARLGPKAVRSIERIGPYESGLKMTPLGTLNIADVGDIPFRSRFSLESCHEDIQDFFKRVTAAGVIPLSVGGDHSISYSILKALGAKEPVGMIHIDAHSDTGGPYDGSKFHHGGPFRLAVLEGVLDPKRTIQIGIRGGAGYLWEFSYDSGMTVLHMDDVVAMGMDAVCEKAREVVGDGPTYISFDIDSIDPGFAPGTGTPEVGGFMPREVLMLLRRLCGIHVIGGDVVEVAPQYDTTSNTAHVAAQMLFEMLCLISHYRTHVENGRMD